MIYGAPGQYYGNPPVQKTGEKIGEPKKGNDGTLLPQPGTMRVTVPDNTKLTIDGYVSQQTSRERILATPPIQPGSEFTYTLVAETTKNGQTMTETQTVIVRPGQVTPVQFTFSTALARSSR